MERRDAGDVGKHFTKGDKMKKLILGVAIALLCGCEEEAGDWVRPFDYQFTVRNHSEEVQPVVFYSGDVKDSIDLGVGGNWCIGSNDSTAFVKIGSGEYERYNWNAVDEVTIL